MSRSERTKQLKKRMRLLLLSCVAALVCLAGVTLAWYSRMHGLSSVALVQVPVRITISGAHRSEMSRISLNLTEDDDIDEGGNVTLRRIFCIESTSDYNLEVAHTTNIPDLGFKLYPATEKAGSDISASDVKGTTPDGRVYYYTPEGTAIAGAYINLKSASESGKLALQEGEEGSVHNSVYDPVTDSGRVQVNAEPLYWKTDSPVRFDDPDLSNDGTAIDASGNEEEIKYRYFVLELTWKQTTQETDMIYLMAAHAS